MGSDDLPLLKLIFGIFNFVYFYKLLKKVGRLRLFVSATRIQSRITGYIC